MTETVRNDVLLHQHPWLHEIDNALPLQTVESRARVAFLEDGVTFMSVLEKFAMARMWRDMLLEICIKEENAFALPFLSVLSDLKDSERYIDTVPFLAHTTSAVINYDDVVQRSQLSPEEQVKYRPFHDMLKSRCDAEVAAKESNHSFLYFDVALVEARLQDKFPSTPLQDMRLTSLIGRIHNDINGAIEWSDSQRWAVFSYSSHWRQLWANIYKLGLLVGAKMPEPQISASPPAICNALQAVVDGQGPVVNRMLALLEERHNIIHQQQQIITALQFRHLLENISPGTGSATDRWQDFWTRAVQKAYDEAIATPPGPPAGTPASPLAVLLTDELVNKAKRQTQTDPVQFLVEHNRFCPTARALYGNLSGSIHQYATEQFYVNPQNFSSHDARLMECLMPVEANLEDGYVNWDKERKRFIVEQQQTP